MSTVTPAAQTEANTGGNKFIYVCHAGFDVFSFSRSHAFRLREIQRKGRGEVRGADVSSRSDYYDVTTFWQLWNLQQM